MISATAPTGFGAHGVGRVALWLRSQGAVLVLACAAVGLSLAAIPRGSELGLLELELGRTEEALANLERRYQEGDRTPSMMSALAAARARNGNPRGAIDILEPLLGTRPGDPGLLKVLAGHYRAVGDENREVAMLERLASVRPSEDLLHTLARLYGRLGRPGDQRMVLTRLVDRPNAAAYHFVELAKAEASQGRYLAGIEVLGRLRTARPRAIDTGIVALEMNLRIAAGQFEEAVATADQWLSRGRVAPQEVTALASVLSVAGHPARAAAMIAPFAEKTGSPALELALAQAEVDAGRGPAVLARLESRAAGSKRPVDPELARFRVRLSTYVGTLAQVVAAAEAAGAANLPDDLRPTVAVAARRTGRTALVEALHRHLARTDTGLPAVVAAQTYLAMGDRTAALAAAARAADMAAIDVDTAVKLASVEQNLLRNGRALSILRAAFGTPTAPRSDAFAGPAAVSVDLLDDLARDYIALGVATEGEAILGAARRLAPSAKAERAWALAATAARRDDAVTAWLAQVDDVPAQYLRELTFLAAGNGSKVAVRAAARLRRETGRNEDRALFAELQVAAGAPVSTIGEPILRSAVMR